MLATIWQQTLVYAGAQPRRLDVSAFSLRIAAAMVGRGMGLGGAAYGPGPGRLPGGPGHRARGRHGGSCRRSDGAPVRAGRAPRGRCAHGSQRLLPDVRAGARPLPDSGRSDRVREHGHRALRGPRRHQRAAADRDPGQAGPAGRPRSAGRGPLRAASGGGSQPPPSSGTKRARRWRPPPGQPSGSCTTSPGRGTSAS